MRPIVSRTLKLKAIERFNEIMANTLAWNVDMTCSKCLTICPYYGITGEGHAGI